MYTYFVDFVCACACACARACARARARACACVCVCVCHKLLRHYIYNNHYIIKI